MKSFPVYPPFAVGDTVMLVCPATLPVVPIGAVGKVLAIEKHGFAFQRGRPYYVEFNMAPYQLKFKHLVRPTQLRSWGLNPERAIPFLRVHVSAGDLKAVEGVRR